MNENISALPVTAVAGARAAQAIQGARAARAARATAKAQATAKAHAQALQRRAATMIGSDPVADVAAPLFAGPALMPPRHRAAPQAGACPA
ncbi:MULTISPECIES: hypothetical protein [unclassified Streptomyces]|uniref:hypothetical protein n=1 Tax=unclassified Streptomyces TaxID=2593676 RepID=UPI00343D0EA2